MRSLRIGMVFKNYCHLCRFLDVIPKTGNQGKAQRKEFSKYFRFRKIKNRHKIKIIEVR